MWIPTAILESLFHGRSKVLCSDSGLATLAGLLVAILTREKCRNNPGLQSLSRYQHARVVSVTGSGSLLVYLSLR